MVEEFIVTEVTEVTEVTTAVVHHDDGAKKKKSKKVKPRSHSSCSSCTTCAGRYGKQKRVAPRKGKSGAHGHHSSRGGVVGVEKTTVDDHGVHKEAITGVVDAQGHLVVDNTYTDIHHEHGMTIAKKQEVVSTMVTGDHGEELAVQQNVETVVAVDDKTGEYTVHTVKEHAVANSDEDQVVIRDETVLDVGKYGEAEVHHEVQRTVDMGGVHNVTREVDDYQVDNIRDVDSSSDIHHTNHQTLNETVVVDRAYSAPSRSSSIDSVDTIILMKKLEKKIRHRKAHTPHGMSQNHHQTTQVKVRAGSFSSSDYQYHHQPAQHHAPKKAKAFGFLSCMYEDL